MKSLLLCLILLFSVAMIGCKEKEMAIGEGQLRDGKLYEPNQTEPFTGKVKSFEGYVTYKDGILNGAAEFSHGAFGSTQQKLKLTYLNNIPSGRIQTWSYNGTVIIDKDYSKMTILDKLLGSWISGKQNDDNRIFIHLDKDGQGYISRVTTENNKKFNVPILFNITKIDWGIDTTNNIDEATIRYKVSGHDAGGIMEFVELNYISMMDSHNKVKFNRIFIIPEELQEMVATSRTYY